jgi:hypothetical protein
LCTISVLHRAEMKRRQDWALSAIGTHCRDAAAKYPFGTDFLGNFRVIAPARLV